MFKIIKKSTFNDMVQANESLSTEMKKLVAELNAARDGWGKATNQIHRQLDELVVAKTKINACHDTKKYLKGQLEERFATIEKLKKELADTQFALKVARKEVEIPTSSNLEKAAPKAEVVPTPQPAMNALPAEVVPTPQPAQKRKRTYTKRAGGKK